MSHVLRSSDMLAPMSGCVIVWIYSFQLHLVAVCLVLPFARVAAGITLCPNDKVGGIGTILVRPVGWRLAQWPPLDHRRKRMTEVNTALGLSFWRRRLRNITVLLCCVHTQRVPSTQTSRTLVRKTMKGLVLGTRIL